ncbi:MAG: PQQ-dependent sugar dehydrogenase [Proteobacteria bacterium]|nr:PQQ-dependent sugar dehydrogenase [Pseudomonadota bacterium]
MRIVVFLVAALAAKQAAAQAPQPQVMDKLKVVTVASGLEHPWSLAFLPGGSMLVTERPGRLRIVAKNGALSQPLTGLPAIDAQGQGGLLDVALDPKFSTNHTIYFSYSEPRGDRNGTAVAKAELGASSLTHVQVIFRQTPKAEGGKHFGSRLAFAPDGTLFITLGERYDLSKEAQNLATHLGKVVHINTDGTPAANNPFLHQKDALPEIWSYGHRNMQGATIHPETGALWTAEHGPRGGDEINLDEAGKNYGWPKASYGSHYSGWPIPDEHASRGFAEPVFYWNPSISPSGMVFYTGDRFPQWQGDLLVGGLSGMCLIRLDMKDGKVVKEERLLADLGERIRDVRQGPDGFVYLLTDNDQGRLLRIEPQ